MKNLRLSVFRGCKIVAASLLLHSLPAAATLQQSESFAVGSNSFWVAQDPVTAKVFVTYSTPPASTTSRFDSGGGLSVLDSAGHVTSIPLSGKPDNVAVSALFRTAIVPINNCTCTALVNIDSFAVTMVGGGQNSRGVVVSEATGHAYVLALGLNSPARGTSSITDIDLRSGSSNTYPVPGMSAVGMAGDAGGTKLYVIGYGQGGTAQYLPGLVQAFDVATKSMSGAPMLLGKMPLQVIAPGGGSQIYVLGHSDYLDSSVPSGDPRRSSVQPAIFALDSASLALQRSIALPYTTNLDLVGPVLIGNAAVDPTTGVVYVTDANNKRFMVVDPATSGVTTVNVESGPWAVAANPVAGNVIVTLNGLGLAAIYSMSGERLDTVPIGTSLNEQGPFAGVGSGDNNVALDVAGNAYVTSGHDGSVALLKRNASPPAIVNLTDVWSDPADPGWGVFVQQQGAIAFAALFIHDAAGAPRWVVMPQGMRQGDGSFSGSLYRTTGPATNAGATTTSLVGTMSFAAQSLQAATLTYTLDGATVTRSVSRLPISAVPRTCAWTVNTLDKSATSASSNFTSLWWNPAQSGWGLALSQQGGTSFAVMFGYDASNQAAWTFMSDGTGSSVNGSGGTLYRSMSGTMLTVGDMSLSFSGTDAGTLSYKLDGALVTTPIVRQEFSTPASRCSS